MTYGLIDIVKEVSGLRGPARGLRRSEFWAVKDVSFELCPGETIAVIGRNGSGKSTLLKLIAGVLKPDQGCITHGGRLSVLVSLGAGFNPLLTGRENVVTNLALLGLSRREIRERVDEVIRFAEIGEAIDAPLQAYSSGMAARLGFACAVHTSPDILLIDEILSVGDARFRSKCYRKLHDLRRAGVATVLVTHNTNAVLTMADRAIYLDRGRMIADGDPATVLARYEEDLIACREEESRADSPRTSSGMSGGVLTIEGIELLDRWARPVDAAVCGEPATLAVRYRALRRANGVGLGVIVRELTEDSDVVLNLHSERDGRLFEIETGCGRIEVRFPALGLRPRVYSARVYLSAPGLYVYDLVDSYRFRVVARETMSQNLYFQPREWHASPLSDVEWPDGSVGGRV
ncbi:MAG TPA: ABC transporter ATP-binding protein [Nitrospiraceae bacterium]|nr:ABC transporter ATP-binding protein [Nitrospiraceae bacterium]